MAFRKLVAEQARSNLVDCRFQFLRQFRFIMLAAGVEMFYGCFLLQGGGEAVVAVRLGSRADPGGSTWAC